MARISGVDIPNEKRLDIGLTYLYGIGRSNVKSLLKDVEMDPARRVKTLTDEEISKIAKVIDKNFLVEGDLRQEVSGNIKRLKEIGAYRGARHAKNLPTRGQRTKSNARTKRGKRSTVGAQKKDDRIKQTEAKAESPEKK
ncbi:MAG: 30S ribosomal protein S13 [Candidatus Gottesmanbacteria bacterium GW2011_GWA2_44_17]|uniref:Small ribosomal subunit protein uS13 n=3 Tax=Candidatus Gottesmaniibacteriota TaxID=1752720 RepID=A0A0G1IQE9_9BACT|nr:MAG: 30S ribosomal protein S13 [Microgenomates group bacterium GW2011_GWC1_43_11]KKT38673.1 MAG: 30S ribosomal protein S13 [Candidatus Gottesmanbacteria bacterium GW2011_GWB1_44_11c]KKT47367.1 MAG: 30S ribosomal protein S13 [Candidatus Gottesmanbacteria bacterium GW2011_GWA2_44_17]KKT61168.1 MAG: 30S ribosomal protein S13 [Candidatus Gottesmanbacteria bacterium GW2011_GWA1_44_24b]HCM82431.1 30S ribosomal protein S13 [Patescibacteria group bacterium]